ESDRATAGQLRVALANRPETRRVGPALSAGSSAAAGAQLRSKGPAGPFRSWSDHLRCVTGPSRSPPKPISPAENSLCQFLEHFDHAISRIVRSPEALSLIQTRDFARFVAVAVAAGADDVRWIVGFQSRLPESHVAVVHFVGEPLARDEMVAVL